MPDWREAVRERLAGLRLDPAREAGIVEELAQHAADRYEELVGRGAEEAEALRSVLAELDGKALRGGLSPLIARTPGVDAPGREDGTGFLAGLVRDLRQGMRRVRLEPGFAALAILSLALGVGANTAIFQLLDALRLRSLPVPRPRELAMVRIVDNPHGRTGGFTGRFPHLTNALWERIAASQQAFSSAAAWASEQLNLAPGGEARYAEALWVSGTFFETVEVRPLLGRLLSPADDRPGCAASAAVVSEPFWRRELGGSPNALGSRIRLEGVPFEVVGVTPAGFFGLEVGRRFDVALPLCAEARLFEKPRVSGPDEWWLAWIGRLRPGWTTERASAHLQALSRGIFEATLPPSYDATNAKYYLGFRLGVLPCDSGYSALRAQYRDPLNLLLGISGLVLLLACANLANLMVARASARQREIAVRLALGASRRRLIRQLLAESFVLAAIGAAAGAALAQVLTRLLVSFLTTPDGRWFVELRPDGRLLGFTALLAGLTCVLFGLLPALQASRTQPIEAMKSGSRGIASGSARLGLRRALVVGQVSLSLVLLVGSVLFVRTLRNLLTLDAGFRRDHILVTELDLSPLRIPAAARPAVKREILDRIRAIPGVSSAADARIVPASGSGWNETITVEGTGAERQTANFNRVSPGYFGTMGISLLAGRDFGDVDRPGAPDAAIVTETFVRRFLAGASPIGRTVRRITPEGDRLYTIVGLVPDSKYESLREEFTSIVYLAAAQDDVRGPYERILIRSNLPVDALVSSVKATVAQRSPSIVLSFRVFDDTLRENLLPERLMATISGFFGLLAALLATVGLYGVISYMVVRRRNEIGVRMALGASRGDILAMVLREAAVLLGIGLSIGTVLALLAARPAGALLYGLRPTDPGTLLASSAALAAAAIAASLLPARRAAGLDPMAALREN
jgi:predicted permease